MSYKKVPRMNRKRTEKKSKPSAINHISLYACSEAWANYSQAIDDLVKSQMGFNG